MAGGTDLHACSGGCTRDPQVAEPRVRQRRKAVLARSQTVRRSDITRTMLPGPTISTNCSRHTVSSHLHRPHPTMRTTYLLMPTQENTHPTLSTPEIPPARLREPARSLRRQISSTRSRITAWMCCSVAALTHALVQVLHQCIAEFGAVVGFVYALQ